MYRVYMCTCTHQAALERFNDIHSALAKQLQIRNFLHGSCIHYTCNISNTCTCNISNTCRCIWPSYIARFFLSRHCIALGWLPHKGLGTHKMVKNKASELSYITSGGDCEIIAWRAPILNHLSPQWPPCHKTCSTMTENRLEAVCVNNMLHDIKQLPHFIGWFIDTYNIIILCKLSHIHVVSIGSWSTCVWCCMACMCVVVFDVKHCMKFHTSMTLTMCM